MEFLTILSMTMLITNIIVTVCIWDNKWKNALEGVMGWFDQGMFDYNYDLR